MTDIDKSKAEKDYLAGLKYKKIAEKYGVTINTVKSWKQRYGWNKKGRTQKEKVCTQKNAACDPPIPQKIKEELTEGLTEKEKLFCEIYVQNWNATQAAIKAGYSVDSARSIGYENLTKPHIRNYVETLKEAKRMSIMINEDDIVERYMRIAFSDITDFVEFGRTLVPVMTMYGPLMAEDKESGEKKAVMKEVNDVRFKESWVVDGGIISQIKMGKDGASIKLEDRQKALEWLANYFNMNPMNKHKIAYDNAYLEMEKKKASTGDTDSSETGVVEIANVLPDDDKDGVENG